jgi:hypothetical protein
VCDCKSYNKQIGIVEEVVLPRPHFLNEGERINGVPVDACIADVVKELWACGVITCGSCCGHNKERASLVIGRNESSELVRKLLGSIDKANRDWQLFQWQERLIEV